MIIEFCSTTLSIDNGRLTIEGGSLIIETAVQMLQAAACGETELTLVNFPAEMLDDLEGVFAACNQCGPDLRIHIQ